MFGRRERKQPKKRTTPTIADECEAFLSGHIADLYEESELTVPCWAELNRLAHGSLQDLEQLATDSAPMSTRLADASWRYTLRRLSAQMITDIDDPAALRRVQAAVLWPLEEQLLAAPDGPVQTPSELFRIVVSVLREHSQSGTDT